MKFSKEYLRSYVGKKVRLIRKDKKMSQEKLAQMIGCSRVSISSIENGNKACSVEKIYEMASIFEVSHLYFLPDESID